MKLNRRQLITSLTAGMAASAARCSGAPQTAAPPETPAPRPIRLAGGEVDWRAVRDLFPLAPDWIHLASFLLVSHPKPVADAIERFRNKIDADPTWIERAAFSDSEGHPLYRDQARARRLRRREARGDLPDVEHDRRAGHGVPRPAYSPEPGDPDDRA